MSGRLHHRAPPAGFTLVELMIALAVSTLVTATALSVFVTITGSQRRQTASRRGEALEALDLLRRDAACAIPTAFTAAPPFELSAMQGIPGTDRHRTEVTLTVGRLEDGSTDMTRLRVWRVSYRPLPAAAPQGTFDLLREAVRLDGPGAGPASETGIVFRGMAAFDVGALDGTIWTNRWTSSPRTPLPGAVRVALGWTEGAVTSTATAWTVLPAARTFRAPNRQAAAAR